MAKYHHTFNMQKKKEKKKNTRQLRAGASMQQKRSYLLKGSLKTTCGWLQVSVVASYGNWWKAGGWWNMTGGLHWNEGTTGCSVKWTGVLSVCRQTAPMMELFLVIAIRYCVINLLYSLLPLRNNRNVRKKKKKYRYEMSPWTVASKFSVLNKPL